MIAPTRFLGLDVHKQSVVVSVVDAHQEVLLPARRVALAEFEQWVRTHLLATDAVVLEASTNAWQFYDLLEPLVASVTVAHPFLIKLIAQARVKTDGRDALHLAKLLAANLILAVWVPPKPVRDLRAILAHRRRITLATDQGPQSSAQHAASAQSASTSGRSLSSRAACVVG